ncbi:MAG: DUF6614 family protein [Pseudomonadota bacterium]
MNIYHAFFDLEKGQSDLDFAEDLKGFLDYLTERGKIEGWRLMRRKLGLGPTGMGEFHLMIETRDLAQLDAAFEMASERTGEMEDRHASVNQKVSGITFALYRDFPDPHRKHGEEKF